MELVYHITDFGCVVLGRTEHQSLFVFADVLQELLDTGLVPLLDGDVPLIKVLLRIDLTFFHFARQDFVFRRVDVIVNVALHLAMPERSEETISDAFLQGILIDRFPEVFIGVRIDIPSRCGGHTELHGTAEILHNAPPTALIIRTPTMALIYDNEVKEVLGVLTEVAFSFLSAIKGLEDGEEDGCVGRDLAILADTFRSNAAQSVICKPEEAVESLVCEDIPVGKEEDTGPIAGLPHIPPRMEELVRNLE